MILHKLIGGTWMLAAAPAALLLASGTALAADQTIDEFEAAQQAAWNAHDAGAYAAAFDQNARIITAQGWNWTGQAEAASKLGDGFKVVYARAHLRISGVKVHMLTPELASVTMNWSIDGARTIDAGQQAGQQNGVQTQLLQNHGGGWLVLSQQDTQAASSPTPAQALEQAAPPPAASFPVTRPPVRRCIVGRANGECLIYGKPKPDPAS